MNIRKPGSLAESVAAARRAGIHVVLGISLMEQLKSVYGAKQPEKGKQNGFS